MYLVRSHTRETVLAEINPITPEELKPVQNRFIFKWREVGDTELYGLWLVEEKEVVGLMALKDIPDELRIEIILLESSRENVGKKKLYERIAGCLIAFACRLAFLRGYFGFISLIPKTRLIAHYQTLYGFEQYGRHLGMDLDRSQRLIEQYLNDER